MSPQEVAEFEGDSLAAERVVLRLCDEEAKVPGWQVSDTQQAAACTPQCLACFAIHVCIPICRVAFPNYPLMAVLGQSAAVAVSSTGAEQAATSKMLS